MFCITLHEDGEHHKYHCCCGCGLIWGVIFIFVMEVLSLISAIQFLDITGIVVSGILTGMFFISCCSRENAYVRFGLFFVYLGRALVFAVHMVYYMLSQNATTLVANLCT